MTAVQQHVPQGRQGTTTRCARSPGLGRPALRGVQGHRVGRPGRSPDPRTDERWILTDADELGAHPWYKCAAPASARSRSACTATPRSAKVGRQFEQLLIAGVMHYLIRMENDNPEFRYAMHEVTEETHHIQMFQEPVNRSGADVVGASRPGHGRAAHQPRPGPGVPSCSSSASWPARSRSTTCRRASCAAADMPPADRPHHADPHRRGGPPHRLRPPVPRDTTGRASARSTGSSRSRLPGRHADALRRDHGPEQAGPARRWASPRRSPRRSGGRRRSPKKLLRDMFGDVRMLADSLGMPAGSRPVLWKAIGIDGASSRFRSEPTSAAA